jgi:hypothetical protein
MRQIRLALGSQPPSLVPQASSKLWKNLEGHSNMDSFDKGAETFSCSPRTACSERARTMKSSLYKDGSEAAVDKC